jgi:hypothetical protein
MQSERRCPLRLSVIEFWICPWIFVSSQISEKWRLGYGVLFYRDIEYFIDLTYSICTYLYHYFSKSMLCPVHGELGSVLEFHSAFSSASRGCIQIPGLNYGPISAIRHIQRPWYIESWSMQFIRNKFCNLSSSWNTNFCCWTWPRDTDRSVIISDIPDLWSSRFWKSFKSDSNVSLS